MNLKRAIVSKRQNYIDEYRAAAEKVGAMLGPLSQRQLSWYPSPGVWSVAQCISHLIVSGNEYKYQIEEAIKKASQERPVREDPLRYSLVGKLFINMIEPPVGRKIKTQKFLDPAIINQKNRLIEEFSEINDELIAAVQSSENLDISRIKVVLPVSKLLRFKLTDAFAFIAAHERRHIWQAENVIKSEGFPKA